MKLIRRIRVIESCRWSKRKLSVYMGARRWARGHLPPSNLKKMASYTAVLQITLKFSFAPSALALDTLYFSLQHREKSKMFRLRLRRAEKWSIFCTARRKRVDFLKCRWFCPSGKISAGAHERIDQLVFALYKNHYSYYYYNTTANNNNNNKNKFPRYIAKELFQSLQTEVLSRRSFCIRVYGQRSCHIYIMQ